MKKILFGAAAAALVLSFGFSPATAAPGFNASQYCTSISDGGYSHGDCVAIITKIFDKSTSNDATAICQDIKLEDPDFFDANFKNLGQCVKSFH